MIEHKIRVRFLSVWCVFAETFTVKKSQYSGEKCRWGGTLTQKCDANYGVGILIREQQDVSTSTPETISAAPTVCGTVCCTRKLRYPACLRHANAAPL